jgi:type IV fimbrial biogenesis protein FimT
MKVLPLSAYYGNPRCHRPAHHPLPDRRRQRHAPEGFTLVELLIVVTVLSLVATVAIPSFNSYRDQCCVKAVMEDICNMMREAKQNALCADKDYGITFNPDLGKVSLVSGRGNDDKWNTDDDPVVRSISLAAKGGGLRFGYGSCGPLPDLAATTDGITFNTNNTMVCNTDLTGNAGTVYLISRSGSAMALVVNSEDFSYVLWRWGGKKWLRI